MENQRLDGAQNGVFAQARVAPDGPLRGPQVNASALGCNGSAAPRVGLSPLGSVTISRSRNERIRLALV